MKYFFILILLIPMGLLAQQELSVWEKVPFEIVNDTIQEERTTAKNGIERIAKVKKPTIKLYLLEKVDTPSPMLLICPGGGYSINAIDHEGYQIAEWANQHGMSAAVLKYRLPDDRWMTNKSEVPLMDAQQAIRMIRKNAKEWNVDTEKVGILGFSAGGHLASTVSTHFEVKAGNIDDETNVRPDFSVLIYPVITMKNYGHGGSRRNLIGENPSQQMILQYSNELWVNEKTPPTFLAHSTDDKGVSVENSFEYYQACLKNNVPASMNIFPTGGHGYGMLPDRMPKENWGDMLAGWLKGIGVLE